MLQIGGHKDFFLKNTFLTVADTVIFCQYCLKIADFEVIDFLIKNYKNETEKLMDVRKKSLSPNKKSNAEPALKVRDYQC